MARPSSDIDAMREQLLEHCEDLIRERGAVEFTVSDLATLAGMSPSNVYRYFESKEALWEAMAERFFREKNDIMQQVVASDLPARGKLIAFFGKRLAVMRSRYEDDPKLFSDYLDLGDDHFEVVRGYIDLADHYMAEIIAQAMAEGYFTGLEIDDTVKLMNCMVQPFVSPRVMIAFWPTATQERLEQVIDVMLHGMRAGNNAHQPGLKLVN